MIDWSAIKTEYITTNISYRKLAAKYGVGVSRLGERASDEKWVELREQHRDKTVTKAVESISTKTAAKNVRIQTVADRLLEKIVAMAETAQGAKEIKALTAALRDIKEIKGYQSDLDEKEQKARIANLEKMAEKESETASELTVIFEAGPEEWNE